MQTFPKIHPAPGLATPLYDQVVNTLTNLLPPPLDATQEALSARNHAAIAKVAALRPVNADEADLAVQCIAARAQAEEILRLLRQHANDVGLVMRLNAQYQSMVRTSLSLHGRLMHIQELREKRAAMDKGAPADRGSQKIEKSVPQNGTNSQDAASETELSKQAWSWESSGNISRRLH